MGMVTYFSISHAVGLEELDAHHSYSSLCFLLQWYMPLLQATERFGGLCSLAFYFIPWQELFSSRYSHNILYRFLLFSDVAEKRKSMSSQNSNQLMLRLFSSTSPRQIVKNHTAFLMIFMPPVNKSPDSGPVFHGRHGRGLLLWFFGGWNWAWPAWTCCGPSLYIPGLAHPDSIRA